MLRSASTSLIAVQRVTTDYGKNFDFFKQHTFAHGTESVRDVGVTLNQSTRPGEGFIQEVKQQYKRTNGRDAEKQVCRAFGCSVLLTSSAPFR